MVACASSSSWVSLLGMDPTCSEVFSDARTILLLLLHLQNTQHSIDPCVHSSDELAVNLLLHHLFQNNLEHLIDRIVGGSDPSPVVSDTILNDLHRVLHTCGGLAGFLSQANRFCMWRIGVHHLAALTNACIRVLQDWKTLRLQVCARDGVLRQ